MAADGTGSLGFMEDVTADRSSKINSEVYLELHLLLTFNKMLHN